MKHVNPSTIDYAEALLAVPTPPSCPAQMDLCSGNACTCRGILKTLCKLERGIISWKHLTFLELLEIRQTHTSHPALPNHEAASAFEKYWRDKSWQEIGGAKGWKPVYANQLPPREMLLREDRLPFYGQYGAVDADNSIIARVSAERFVLMMMTYIQIDRRGLFDVLAIDVDCNFDLELLRAAGFPMPRYFVSRRRQPGDAPTFVRRPHLVFWLRRPVGRYQNNRQTKAARYFEAIRQTLIQRLMSLGLKVDPKRPDLTKNPHSDTWDTVQGDYRDWSLAELHRALGGPLKSPKAPWKVEKTNTAPETPLVNHPGDGSVGTSHDKVFLEGYGGRNDLIFNKTRFFGYSLKRQNLDDAVIARSIDQFAHDLNQERFDSYFKGPLKRSEVDDTIRSVTDFVLNRYEPGADSKDRGACSREGLIHAGMTKKIRQGVGGTYAASKNADKTRQRVQEAIDALGGDPHVIAVSALAEEAGVSRPTARKWRNIIAAEMPVSSAPEVEKTVHIRKGDVIPAPAAEQVWIPGTAGVVLDGLAWRLAQTSICSVDKTSAANSPYQPIPVRRDAGKPDLYRHPFNNGLVLTEKGDVLRVHVVKIGTQSVKRAPLHVLDRAGFLDDSPDEYAPPVGESDHLGRVRFDEGYHAPTNAGLVTREWSDDEVDRYITELKSA